MSERVLRFPTGCSALSLFVGRCRNCTAVQPGFAEQNTVEPQCSGCNGQQRGREREREHSCELSLCGAAAALSVEVEVQNESKTETGRMGWAVLAVK